MRTHIPPLSLPVDRTTPDNLSNTQFAYKRITHIQEDLGRLAWVYLPEGLLQAERCQAISDIGNGTILYEAREVFNGPLAGILNATFEKGLQLYYEAQWQGLKLLLERDYGKI